MPKITQKDNIKPMVTIKTTEELKIMAEAGKILSGVVEKVATAAEIGTSLKDLDKLAEELMRQAGAEPGFLNYQPHGASKPYSASICASINDVIVHGLPTHYKLRNGDLLKLDFGVKLNGYYSDAAVTVPIGKISSEVQKLVTTTKKALFLGIKQMHPGNHLGDIGFAIQNYVQSQGFYIVDGLTGHGIGRELHEDPSVFNNGKRGAGIELKEGMVFAIEPMVAAGTHRIVQLPDDSYATYDGSLSAHFEHTVEITGNGPRILT